jgi:hypothetical protein
MPRIIDPDHVEPVVRAMVGAADVDAGPTDEQLSVIGALATTYFGVDLDPAHLDGLGPEETAGAFADPAQRRRVRELIVLVELCRHPTSARQADRAEEYCLALGETGPGLEIARDLVDRSRTEAALDFARFLADASQPLLEPQLAERYAETLQAPDPQLAARLRALGDLPAGTLGREYVSFYERNGFDLPGTALDSPAIFVSHDMCHVIGGYEPVGVGEIALGMMQIGVADTDTHWMQLLGNLGVHEAGYLDGGGKLVPKVGTLGRPGAAETVAHAFWRGDQCRGDFTTIDHLARADEPLDAIRASFGIPPVEV